MRGYTRSQSTAFERLAAALAPHHPVYANFTIVALDDRSRDDVHHFLHRTLGGLMPRIVPFEQYKSDRLLEARGLTVMEEEEAFVRFHLFCRSKGRTKGPEESAQLFSFLRLLSRFSVNLEELKRLDRLSPEQWDRVEGIFSFREEFRHHLAEADRAYLPFEEDFLRSLTPRETDLFVGLPLLTPTHEAFLSKIESKRLFVPEALFGPQFPAEDPEYETAYHLVVRYGLPMVRGSARILTLSEVPDRSALAALVAQEVDRFLQTREPPDQMAILLLDEELSFYLWRFLFASRGEEVNFSPWLPFSHFSPAYRLSRAVLFGEDLTALRETFVQEMRGSWASLDPAEQVSFEAAITLCEELLQWQKEIGKAEEWRPLAQYLIQSKKLHLTGSREAPIQILGLGETGGASFTQALILPMDQDIFPHKPFRGPYLNAIHTPRIYRAQFEANDLLLRQFLSLCQEAHIVARYDKVNGFAPSSHFAFLATEFDVKPMACVRPPETFVQLDRTPAIPSSEEMQQFLRSFTWSFHSLQLFFSCPYHFLLKHKEGIQPPFVLEEGEEAIQLHIGNVLHEWAASLNLQRPVLEHWKERFEVVWKEKVGEDGSPGEEYFSLQGIYKPIVLSYLEDIARDEEERGNFLLFAETAVRSEEELTASFGQAPPVNASYGEASPGKGVLGKASTGQHSVGNGAFRIKGRLDRIQPHEGKTLILDLKYRSAEKLKAPPSGKNGSGEESLSGLQTYLEEKGSLHEAHQLVVYAYLLYANECQKNNRLSPQNFSAAFYALKETDPEKRFVPLPSEELKNLDAHMEQIATKLDEQIAQAEFPPNYKSDQCRFCLYSPICGHPNGLAGGAGW